MRLNITVDGKEYTVEVEQVAAEAGRGRAPRSRSTGSAAGGESATQSAGDGKTIDSPIAGNVVRVLVEPGAEVDKDQPVIVLEAMKMETEIGATVAGKVANVLVAQGDAVTVGQALVEMED